MKFNPAKFFTLTGQLGLGGVFFFGLSACKTPEAAHYSPEWEIKTSVPDSELPVGVTLDSVEDAPMPDAATNLVQSPNGQVEVNGSSVANPDGISLPPPALNIPEGNPGPRSGTEPLMPGHELASNHGAMNSPLLAADAEIRQAPSALPSSDPRSGLVVEDAAPMRPAHVSGMAPSKNGPPEGSAPSATAQAAMAGFTAAPTRPQPTPAAPNSSASPKAAAAAPSPASPPPPAPAPSSPQPVVASAQETAKAQAAEASSGSELAEILALAKRVEAAKARPQP